MRLLLIITVLVSNMSSFLVFSTNEMQRGIIQDCGTYVAKECQNTWQPGKWQ